MFKFIKGLFKKSKAKYNDQLVKVGNKQIHRDELDNFIHSIVIQEIMRSGSHLYSETFIEEDGTIVLKITDGNNKEYIVKSKHFVEKDK